MSATVLPWPIKPAARALPRIPGVMQLVPAPCHLCGCETFRSLSNPEDTLWALSCTGCGHTVAVNQDNEVYESEPEGPGSAA